MSTKKISELQTQVDDQNVGQAKLLCTEGGVSKYVLGSQLGGSAAGKWSSGWSTFGPGPGGQVPTNVGNGATLIWEHSLGTDEIHVQVYMATSSAGANAKLCQFDSNDAAGSSDFARGLFVTGVTSTQITVQLGAGGWTHLSSSGGKTSGNWGTTYTHLKVIALG